LTLGVSDVLFACSPVQIGDLGGLAAACKQRKSGQKQPAKSPTPVDIKQDTATPFDPVPQFKFQGKDNEYMLTHEVMGDLK
jgi:hypothetical protein